MTEKKNVKFLFLLSIYGVFIDFSNNNSDYNLARRLKMIISEDNTLFVRLEELKTFLLKQKYPSSLIDDSIEKSKL